MRSGRRANRLVRRGDYAAAHKILAGCAVLARQKLGEDNPFTIVFTSNLTEVLRLRGDLALARVMGEKAVPAVRQACEGQRLRARSTRSDRHSPPTHRTKSAPERAVGAQIIRQC